MKRTLDQVVEDYNKEHGYQPEDCSDYEYFIECLAQGVVQKETVSEHRWYDLQEIVIKVVIDGEDRYFKTFDYHITGDLCAGDMDLDMPTLDDVVEVYPHQVTKTVYY